MRVNSLEQLQDDIEIGDTLKGYTTDNNIFEGVIMNLYHEDENDKDKITAVWINLFDTSSLSIIRNSRRWNKYGTPHGLRIPVIENEEEYVITEIFKSEKTESGCISLDNIIYDWTTYKHGYYTACLLVNAQNRIEVCGAVAKGKDDEQAKKDALRLAQIVQLRYSMFNQRNRDQIIFNDTQRHRKDNVDFVKKDMNNMNEFKDERRTEIIDNPDDESKSSKFSLFGKINRKF